MKSIAGIVWGFALALASAVSFAEGTDELWEMTMSMESEGMSMPGMTNKVCQKKGANQEVRSPPLEKDCKMTDSKRSGNKSTFSFMCDGKEGKYSGTGETETLGKDAYRGKMKSSGVREGEKFDMTMTFAGKRVGNCTWEDPGKQMKEMQAQSNAAIAKECDKLIAELEHMMFFGGEGLPPEMLFCKERKADFCANTAKVLKTARDATGYSAMNRKYSNWREAAKACGTDPASISGPVCKSAIAKKEWTFLRSNCETESAALHKAHCAGRTYDTVDAAYRELCVQLGGLSYTAEQPDASKAKAQGGGEAAKPQAAQEAAPPKTTDKLKEGADKLKKFLKF